RFGQIDDPLDSVTSGASTEPGREPKPRGRIAGAQRLAVVARVAKLRQMDVRNAGGFSGVREASLREARLTRNRIEPNVAQDPHAPSTELANQLLDRSALVADGHESRRRHHESIMPYGGQCVCHFADSEQGRLWPTVEGRPEHAQDEEATSMLEL